MVAPTYLINTNNNNRYRTPERPTRSNMLEGSNMLESPNLLPQRPIRPQRLRSNNNSPEFIEPIRLPLSLFFNTN
jgi:hypothetical protein